MRKWKGAGRQSKFEKKVAYVVYLVLIFAIMAVIYYAINNYILAQVFKIAVGWTEAAIFAVIITAIYEFVVPRLYKKQKEK